MNGGFTNGATHSGLGERGNSPTLDKVDKLRELIGSRISLPQLVVVGDQSSGKSSVLEGITGFAFPRDAELCTRYATQITCRREDFESVVVKIIPHEDATPDEAARLKRFSRQWTTAMEMDNEKLGEVFRDVNRELRVSTGRRSPDEPDSGNAFSQHLLKIEICSPKQEHFTVIDVPGIFRTETLGLTTENDMALVRNMVMKYMRDSRTIILAIVPANVDPATQEILRLAKQVDPGMKRTMGVLTKPDLAVEATIKQIAIDHVTRKRGELTLGYYIVKNRGPDDVGMSLDESKRREAAFFSMEPWSALKRTGRTGNEALKTQVGALLTDLVKSEFKKLRSEVEEELRALSDRERAMGPQRSDPNAQRAYLGELCDRFQSITRDALSGNYAQHAAFFSRDSNRLITRIVELDEQFSAAISTKGHTRPFDENENPVPVAAKKAKKKKITVEVPEAAPIDGPSIEVEAPAPQPAEPDFFCSEPGSSSWDVKNKNKEVVADWHDSGLTNSTIKLEKVFPVINKLPALSDCKGLIKTLNVMSISPQSGESIMNYIRKVYTNSRTADLGTFNGSLLVTIFMEQSKNWEALMRTYIGIAVRTIEKFFKEAMKEICQDSQVEDALCQGYLRDHVGSCFRRARKHADSLLNMERGCAPWTVNHYFNENLSKAQGDRLISNIRQVAAAASETVKTVAGVQVAYTLTEAQLQSIATHNQSNAEHTQEYILDVLKSYYKVAMKRFIDNISLYVVHHDLLYAEDGPLNVFNSNFVYSLDEFQLDQIAGESILVRSEREKLAQDIENFRAALDVLKGTPAQGDYAAADTDY
ncbi:uncharacterized protein PpBr36_10533 [Pyricularia pennisetigena]|uniref:uncharacterized protein n=1 Tax=Pyricularia pennisetigena TaxID=1578925 RepID=UPI00114E7C33|nr:uncharacterized protein PpBr36_10533 [Pyricularia pennisetigena]TLS21268.1 hypothetical protein PpBr36_10533 [Pyricularia pennisetigena]